MLTTLSEFAARTAVSLFPLDTSGFSLFSASRSADFRMFTPAHLVALALALMSCVPLYLFRMPIRRNPRLARTLRWLLAGLLLLCELFLHVWYIANDIWRAPFSLPLELCGITLLLSIVMLLTRSRLLYQFLFFAGIFGALIALLTPNLVYPFPHFRFLLFFVAHAAIIWASLFMTWIEGFRPTLKSVGIAMLGLNLVAAAVWTANRLLGSNYMFLMHKPSTYSVLDYFGPYPYYLLVEEGFALLLFLAAYGLFFALPDRLGRRGVKSG